MLQRPVEILQQHQQHLPRVPSPQQEFSLDPVVLGFIQQVVTMSSPSSFNSHSAFKYQSASEHVPQETTNVWKAKKVSPLVTSPASYNSQVTNTTSISPPQQSSKQKVSAQEELLRNHSPKAIRPSTPPSGKKKSKLKQALEPSLMIDEEPLAHEVSTPNSSPSNAIVQRTLGTPKNQFTAARQLHLSPENSSPSKPQTSKQTKQPAWQDDSRSDVSDDSCNSSNGSKSRYKTELCRSWEETGYCRYGEKCQFAHGREELRQVSRHHKYKSELCTNYHYDGTCLYGIRCCFIHSIHKRVMGKAASQNMALVPLKPSSRLPIFVQLSEKGLKEQDDEMFDNVLAACDPAKQENDLIIP